MQSGSLILSSLYGNSFLKDERHELTTLSVKGVQLPGERRSIPAVRSLTCRPTRARSIPLPPLYILYVSEADWLHLSPPLCVQEVLADQSDQRSEAEQRALQHGEHHACLYAAHLTGRLTHTHTDAHTRTRETHTRTRGTHTETHGGAMKNKYHPSLPIPLPHPLPSRLSTGPGRSLDVPPLPPPSNCKSVCVGHRGVTVEAGVDCSFVDECGHINRGSSKKCVSVRACVGWGGGATRDALQLVFRRPSTGAQ